MTPLETIRAVNAACDKTHLDQPPVDLLSGKLWRTKFRASAVLWYAVDGRTYKVKAKTLLAARGELIRFLLGERDAAQDVTEQLALIAERVEAAKARRAAKRQVTHAEWVAGVLGDVA